MKNYTTSLYKNMLFVMLLLSANNIFSQCATEHDSNNWTITNLDNSTHTIGQSFVVSCDGILDYFEFREGTTNTFYMLETLDIYAGDDVTATPIYTEAYNRQYKLGDAGGVRVVPSEDLFLESGNQYTVILTLSDSDFFTTMNNEYVDGTAYLDGAFLPDTDFLFKFSISNPSTNCNQGGEFLMATNSVGHNYRVLFARQIEITDPSTLTGLGYYTITNSSRLIRLALYDDLNDTPQNLLTETNIGPIDLEWQVLQVTPLAMQPGKYWIAYIMNAPFYPIDWYRECTGSLKIHPNKFLDSFESDFPDPFDNQATNMDTCMDPIFAELTCGILNVNDFKTPSISFYPNPAKEVLYFSGMEEQMNYLLYTLDGREISKGTLAKNAFIDVSNLISGMFFIRFENGLNYKFIKE